MKVELMDGILSASGTLRKMKDGTRIIVTTRRAATTNPAPRTRMYIRSSETYQRTTPVTEKEISARQLFVRRQAYVQELMASGRYHTKAEAWKVAKKEIR